VKQTYICFFHGSKLICWRLKLLFAHEVYAEHGTGGGPTRSPRTEHGRSPTQPAIHGGLPAAACRRVATKGRAVRAHLQQQKDPDLAHGPRSAVSGPRHQQPAITAAHVTCRRGGADDAFMKTPANRFGTCVLRLWLVQYTII
jgi:hypothetical protein